MVRSSNNTNKLSPQELCNPQWMVCICSNNTNKLSPQELFFLCKKKEERSNNTNKLSPQELYKRRYFGSTVQIIQINLVLKNNNSYPNIDQEVQIIQINLVLKNLSQPQQI